MKPASEPTTSFAATNSFLLAVLGVRHVANQVVSWMPVSADDQLTQPESGAEPHELDLALLGLAALGQRLDQLGSAPAIDDGELAVPDSIDLLR